MLCCAVLCCAHAGAPEQAVMMANAKAIVREQTFEGSLAVTLCARRSLNFHAEEQLLTGF